VPARAQRIRVIMTELARIGSHLIFFGTSALELGAQSAFLYAWRERERILEINEMVSGVRMMTSFIRVGGLMADVPAEFDPTVRAIVRDFKPRIDEYESLLTENPLWLDRTRGLGVFSAADAIAYGWTGPCLRASGIDYDVRTSDPYSGYDEYEFDVPVGTHGDVYDRYLVRVQEMRESLRIIEQALDRLEPGPVVIDNRKVVLPPRSELDISMEAVIHHFKIVTEGFRPPPGEVYLAVENPRGECGFYIVSDASNKPYRLKVRAPSFNLVAAIPELMRGCLIADTVAILGSLDFVLGDVDRCSTTHTPSSTAPRWNGSRRYAAVTLMRSPRSCRPSGSCSAKRACSPRRGWRRWRERWRCHRDRSRRWRVSTRCSSSGPMALTWWRSAPTSRALCVAP
jgi:NADH-quinone oxidoreductase subunit D